MGKLEIPDARNLGFCREYHEVYMVGYACNKFLISLLTCFGDDLDST